MSLGRSAKSVTIAIIESSFSWPRSFTSPGKPSSEKIALASSKMPIRARLTYSSMISVWREIGTTIRLALSYRPLVYPFQGCLRAGSEVWRHLQPVCYELGQPAIPHLVEFAGPTPLHPGLYPLVLLTWLPGSELYCAA